MPPDDAREVTMRAPCKKCDGTSGILRPRGAQDCVFCLTCEAQGVSAFQYNAPRVETGRAVRTVTTVHNGVKPRQRALVIMRASARCELCGRRPTGSTTELHVGHALSVSRAIEMGLPDDVINSDENLIAMCDQCNLGLGREPVPVRLLVAIIMARLGPKKDDPK